MSRGSKRTWSSGVVKMFKRQKPPKHILFIGEDNEIRNYIIDVIKESVVEPTTKSSKGKEKDKAIFEVTPTKTIQESQFHENRNQEL